MPSRWGLPPQPEYRNSRLMNGRPSAGSRRWSPRSRPAPRRRRPCRAACAPAPPTGSPWPGSPRGPRAGHRSGVRAVDEAARIGAYLDRPEETFVVGNAGVHHRANAGVGCRAGERIGHVDGALTWASVPRKSAVISSPSLVSTTWIRMGSSWKPSSSRKSSNSHWPSGKRTQLGTGELFGVVHEIAHLGPQGLQHRGSAQGSSSLPPPAGTPPPWP